MEEARHWVWAKRKHGLISATNSHDQLHRGAPNKSSSYDESWEEQAFAEDAAGSLLGGCVWPPRSYSCSFCRREFRSAQALGGHMNVHRRDRARLKQSPPDQNNHDHLNNSLNNNNINNIPFHQNINVSPLMVTTTNSTASQNIPQFPSQVCALVYNPNPNIVSDIFSSPPSQLCEENYEKQVLFPLDKESSNRQVLFNPSSQIFSRSNSGTMDRCYQMKDLREEQKVSSLTVESGGSCRAKSRDYHHHVKTHDLSVSLNLVVCRSCPSSLSSGYNIKEDCDHHDHSVSTCKRRRIVYEEEPCSSQLISVDDHNPAILKPSSGNNQHHQQDFLQKEVLIQHSPCSIKEELDLELRLGTRTP